MSTVPTPSHDVHDGSSMGSTRSYSAPPHALQRLAEVRRREGVSRRTVGSRLGLTAREVACQEEPYADMRLTQLYRWQAALQVPVAELLVDEGVTLDNPVRHRAALMRVMRTAQTILEAAQKPQVKLLAQNLVNQLTELMPELADVGPWHSVGQRRTRDELGRIAENVFPSEVRTDL